MMFLMKEKKDIRSEIKFKGKLKEEQNEAAEKLLHHSDGILNAATAFGKTVVCS